MSVSFETYLIRPYRFPRGLPVLYNRHDIFVIVPVKFSNLQAALRIVVAEDKPVASVVVV